MNCTKRRYCHCPVCKELRAYEEGADMLFKSKVKHAKLLIRKGIGKAEALQTANLEIPHIQNISEKDL